MNSLDLTPPNKPTKVEVPKELPKVSMVNTSLNKLKHHLAGFDVLIKERTTATSITEAQSQEKDMVINKLKERIRSLCGNIDKDKAKKDIEEIEMINIELDHRVLKLIAENEHLKQTYKQLYDLIRSTRLLIAALRNVLRKLKGKAIVDNTVTTHTINPKMLKVNVEPVALRLLNNRTVYSDYLRLTQEQAAILREVVDQGKF
nr:hypothetical protein [Tanacetum cinerariifolium]